MSFCFYDDPDFSTDAAGFVAFVTFFHLQDLVTSTSTIRWFDDFRGDRWDFDASPLPSTASAYRGYLENVAKFVSSRNVRIGRWIESNQANGPA